MKRSAERLLPYVLILAGAARLLWERFPHRFVFGKNLQELKPQDSYAIAAMMAQVPGWERTTQIRRQPLYGRQRLYRKTL